MDEPAKRRFSIRLFEVLEQQGYTSTRIKHRSKALAIMIERLHIPHCSSSEIIVAGSVGEGISKLGSSDIDMIYIVPEVMCVDEGPNEKGILVARNKFTQTPPGYVRLQVDDSFTGATGIPLRTSLVSGKRYLDNTAIKQFLQNMCEEKQYPRNTEINGPAVTSYGAGSRFMQVLPELLKALPFFSNATLRLGNNGQNGDTDVVIGLPFYSSKILDNWLNRERLHEWPSKALQDKIAAMMGYVVPVGHKSSPVRNTEWRISYTTAEKKLVRSMNNVQVKLYVVLKLVRKERLKPVCPNFTSYMVKNLVFWVLELTPISRFTPHNLVDIIMSALRILKRFLTNNILPCYIIPDRNLLVERMNEEERNALLEAVECYIAEDYEIILKNPKLSMSMQLRYSYPEKARDYALWIAEIEDEFFLHLNAFADEITTVTGIEQITQGEDLLNAFKILFDSEEHVRGLIPLWLLIIPYDDLFTNGDLERKYTVFCNTLKNGVS